MAYCTKNDLLLVLTQRDLAQLTDDQDNNAINDSIVSAHIAKADNEINTYLRGKASVIPFVTVPARVVDFSVIITIVNLYMRRVDIEIPEAIRLNYTTAIDQLKNIRDGKILIEDPTGAANTGSIYKGSGASQGTIFDTNCDGTGTLDDYYNGPLNGSS